MIDYTYPSIFFAYLFFAICAAGAAFFFVRSFRDGYWGENGEDVKYVIFDEESAAGTGQRQGGNDGTH